MSGISLNDCPKCGAIQPSGEGLTVLEACPLCGYQDYTDPLDTPDCFSPEEENED